MVDTRAVGEQTVSPLGRALLHAPLASGNDVINHAIDAVQTNEEFVEIKSHEPFSNTSWASEFKRATEEDADDKAAPENAAPHIDLSAEGRKAEGNSRGPNASLLRELRQRLAPPLSFFSGPFARELDSILDAIGGTPLVRLSRIAQMVGCSCQLLAKCEFLNAGGSSKDRIAKAMVFAAEQEGLLHPGATLVEPTSGNTGIGLAMTAAVRGYNSVIVMPRKMSNEKQAVLRALGACIVRTPSDVAWNDQKSHMAVSLRLQKRLNSQLATLRDSGALLPDQYRNALNPLAHFWTTAEELLSQCGGRLDMLVVGAGTGGTISGIGRLIKQRLSDCLVVGVDPEGSQLSSLVHKRKKGAKETSREEEKPKALKGGRPYHVEGIGYDFVPTVLDGDIVDFWEAVSDQEAFHCARLLLRREGMLVGGSSGAALAGALKAISRMKWTNRTDKRVAIVLPDSTRNYISKFVSDEWMADHGFLDSSLLPRQYALLREKRVSSLNPKALVFLEERASVASAAKALSHAPASSARILLVIDDKRFSVDTLMEKKECPVEAVLGVVSEECIIRTLGEGGRSCETCVSFLVDSDVPYVTTDESLARLAQKLELRPVVLVKNQQGLIYGALQRSDVLEALSEELSVQLS